MKVIDLINLTGRVALVTGGSRGLGLAMATALAEMGASVAITARKPAELDAAVDTLAQHGLKVLSYVHDLGRPDTSAALIRDVIQQQGNIDILVNNAGTGWGAPAEEYPLTAWQRVLDVNLTGTFEITRQTAVACMIPRGYGRIINIASLAALRGSINGFKAIAYTASKGGIVSMTRALAGEWGIHGITVNAICPGFIPSKMSSGVLRSIGETVIAETPLRQLGTEDDMKGIVVLLAGAAARHITGQVFTIDGGASAV